MATTLICLLIILASVVLVGIRQQELVLSVLHFWTSIVLSGIFLGISSRVGPPFPVDIANLIIAFCFTLSGFVFTFIALPKQISYRKLDILLLGISFLMLLWFSATRIISIDNLGGIYSGAGMLSAAEDNGKWLNFASHIATNAPVDVQDGTSGSLAVILLISTAICKTASYLFLGGPNVPGEAIQGVLLAQTALIIIAPLSLAPISSGIFALSKMASAKHRFTSKRSSFIVYLSAILAAVFIMLAISSISTFGHMSLMVVIEILVVWASATIYLWQQTELILISGILASWTASVWLPLPTFSIVVAISLIVLAAVRYKGSYFFGARGYFFLCLTITNVLLVIWLTTPEIQYLSSSTNTSTSIHLVIAEGATMSLGRPELLLVLLCLALACMYVFRGEIPHKFRFVLRGFPILFLVGYASLITVYDLRVSSNGWPHYGTRKLTYAFVIVIISTLLPVAIWQLTRLFRSKYLLGGSVLFLIALISLSSTSRKGLDALSPGIWTKFENRVTASTGQTWIDEANPQDKIILNFDNYPLACVAENSLGEVEIGNMDSYFCTRFLVSLNGLEKSTMWVISPQQSKLSEVTIHDLKTNNHSTLNRKVLVIDKNGIVKRTITVSEYLDLSITR